MGWAYPAVLRMTAVALSRGVRANFQLWNDELEQVGTGEVVGETISVGVFAPEDEVVLGTSRRVLRVSGDGTS